MKKTSALLGSLALAGQAFSQTPTDVDGLQLWLDASDGASITSSGGLVSQWSDKSGNGNHATQSDPNRQPTVDATAINGSIPAIHFDTPSITGDATTDGMTINPSLNLAGGPYSIFIVDQYWGSIQERTLQGSDNNWLIGKWRGANAHYSGAFNGPNNVAAGTNVPAIGEGYNGGVSEYRVNGDFFGRSGGIVGPGTLQFGSSGTTAANPPFDEYSQADVAEVLIYDRVLTDVERSEVATYLHNKFDIGQRPTGHLNATRSVGFTGADPGEGLDFSGSFHAAVNATGPGGLTIGDANFTDDTGVIISENSIANWGPAPTAFSGSAADGTLNTIMQSIRWTGTDGGAVDDVTATVGGLTVGNTYKVQMLFGETTNTRHFSVTVNGDVVVDDFLEGAQSGSTESRGVALIHEFVATSETLEVILDGGNVIASGDINPLIQALTVENRGVTGMTTTQTFSSASDLDFTGSFVHAVNMNGAGGLQVGDALFTDESGVITDAENALGIGQWGDPDYGSTADDDNLETVMESIRWTATNGRGEDVSLNLPGLTPGSEYKLQLLFDEHSNADRGFDVMIDGVLVADDFGTGAAFGTEGGIALIHEFTANDTDLDVLLDGFATQFTDKNPILSGFTLELIPEPSHTLLTIFGFSLILLRRRRAEW